MKKPSAVQIQNIVFTAIVAIAAVTIYLAVGRGGAMSGWAPTPTAAATDEPALRFQPMPEAAFLEKITSSKTFAAGRRKGEACAYNLVCGDEYTGAAVLSYTVDDGGYVTAFALRFVCPDEPNEKSKKNADVVYANMYPTFIARQNEAVETMLRELLAAADVNDVFSEPVLLRWYTGAVAARDYKKYYTETYERCEFMAYPSQWSGEQVVICSFMEK